MVFRLGTGEVVGTGIVEKMQVLLSEQPHG